MRLRIVLRGLMLATALVTVPTAAAKFKMTLVLANGYAIPPPLIRFVVVR